MKLLKSHYVIRFRHQGCKAWATHMHPYADETQARAEAQRVKVQNCDVRLQLVTTYEETI